MATLPPADHPPARGSARVYYSEACTAARAAFKSAAFKAAAAVAVQYNQLPEVPEPATLVLVGLGGLGMLLRRRSA